MNYLSLLSLIPTIMRLVDLVRGGVSQGLSFKTLTDLIGNSEVVDIFKTIGETVFPLVKPEYQAAAALAAVYSPDYVKKVQNGMNQLLKPVPPLDVDGHYGPMTQAAVKKWQEAHGLEVKDGWAGDKTMAAMQVEIAKLKEVPPPVVEIPKV